MLDTTLAGIAAQLAAQGAPPRIWVSEFGNIEPGRDEAGVAERMGRMLAAFRAAPSVERWFHYKATGADDQFALFSSGPPPLTRLAAHPAFVPASGAFPCAALNAAGRAWWRESHGGSECVDPDAPPILDSLRPAEPAVAEGDSLTLSAHATDPEGGAFSILWLRPGSDTLGRGPTLTYRPGYRDAGAVPLKVEARDAGGALVALDLSVAVANTPLRPAVAHAEGAPLTAGMPVLWAWETGLPDPDLEAGSLAAHWEIRADSADPEPAQRKSAAPGASTAFADGAVPPGPVWVRVRLRDGTGRETPWSAPRRMSWSGTAASLAAPPREASLAASARGPALLFRLALPRPGDARLDLLDAGGSVRRVAWRGRLEAGRHFLRLDRASLPAGVYLARLRSAGDLRLARLVVLP